MMVFANQPRLFVLESPKQLFMLVLILRCLKGREAKYRLDIQGVDATTQLGDGIGNARPFSPTRRGQIELLNFGGQLLLKVEEAGRWMLFGGR